jgi:hypothetical protein
MEGSVRCGGRHGHELASNLRSISAFLSGQLVYLILQ